MNLKRILFCLTAFAAAIATSVPCAAKRPSGSDLRLLYWNIQNGMWSGQDDNYDRFVEWVKEFDADVCVWCEAQSIYRSGTADRMPEADRYLVGNWGELAVRYGHKYWYVGGHRDNFPQVITSKYPIEVVQRIGEGLSHGALHVKINGVNYVVLHLWPQRYSMGDKTRKDNGGEAFRVEEMRRILDATILNPKFAGEKHWLMMGDFNSHSPLDKPFHGTRNYDVHDLVRSAYSHDIVGDWFSGEFVPSTTGGKARIDFIYCTDGIWDGVKRVETVHDAFTDKASDHRPIVVEFRTPKKTK